MNIIILTNITLYVFLLVQQGQMLSESLHLIAGIVFSLYLPGLATVHILFPKAATSEEPNDTKITSNNATPLEKFGLSLVFSTIVLTLITFVENNILRIFPNHESVTTGIFIYTLLISLVNKLLQRSKNTPST